jgi:hypothetical protein
MITQKEADEILSYVAQNLISPLAFDERKASEVWLELSGNKFNDLCKFVSEMVKKPKTVYTIYEEDHGTIGVAENLKEAKEWLIDSCWVDSYCELWNPQTEESKPICELFPNWEEWFIKEATEEDLENMGFYVREREMI